MVIKKMQLCIRVFLFDTWPTHPYHRNDYQKTNKIDKLNVYLQDKTYKHLQNYRTLIDVV